MRIIHLLRKPLSEGTVASNVLKHGVGGLNIDASRVGSPGEKITTHTQGRGDDGYAANAVYGDYRGGFSTHQTEGQKLGRWPANVILQHLDGCRCDGTRQMRRDLRDATGAGAKTQINDHKGGGQWKSSGRSLGHTMETVANWICEPDCPVARLDADSLAGGMHSAGSSRSAKREAGKTGMFPMDGDGHRFGDTGGASRFYKQVGGKTDG